MTKTIPAHHQKLIDMLANALDTDNENLHYDLATILNHMGDRTKASNAIVEMLDEIKDNKTF